MGVHWPQAVDRCTRDGTAYVLATVLATSGSTPRPVGAKMVITTGATFDSIGGGQLEHLVTERSRELLAGTTNRQEMMHLPLAAAAMQCCGGSVTVLLESFGLPQMSVTLFGAGHVGERVARLLHDLSIAVTLIDNRQAVLDGIVTPVPRICLSAPEDAVHSLDSHACALVMTHDHLLDYTLIRALLKRGPIAFTGLIGSVTKWQRFVARLRQEGIAAARIADVQCPIGLPGIPGKEPMAVAIAVVAQLLRERQRRVDAAIPAPSLSWRQIRTNLVQVASSPVPEEEVTAP